MAQRLLVLGWHNIDPTPGFRDPPHVGRRGFAHQLSLLGRFTNVLPLGRALDLIATGRPLPPRAVVLTFDDGYRDNLELGVPMLARHELPATFFLVPGFLSGTVTAWWEDLAEAVATASAPTLEWQGGRFDLADPAGRLAAEAAVRGQVKQLDHAGRRDAIAELAERLGSRRPGGPGPFMDWDGARALLAAGHEIGSHTVSHAILSREDAAGQGAELGDARRALQSELDVPADTLAYPNGASGDYSEQTTALAAELGYRAAVTTRAGLAHRGGPPYEMKRVIMTPITDLRSVVDKVWRKGRSLLQR